MLESQSAKKPNKKRTFRLQINRKDSRRDLIAYMAVPVITNDRIVIEFQCDEGTQLEVKGLMERMD